MRRLAVAILALQAGCGCDHGVFGDAFPIGVSTARGPVIAHVSEGDGAVRDAVIDLLAPLTLLDAPDGAAPTRRCTDLTLYGDVTEADATSLVARAHLDLTITAMHACPDADCKVGPAADPAVVGAVIGGDAFDTGAVRFDFARSELTLFPDVAGDASGRGRLCEAQVDRPFRGGGTLFLGGTEVSFPARRIAVGACLAYEVVDETADAFVEQGADLELVVSTGIGPTILSETAYERWRATFAKGSEPPASSSLAAGSVWLPSGEVVGKVGLIDRMALVGRDDDNRGPCRQVYAHHLLSKRDCTSSDTPCPCNSGERRCSVPAVLELAPAAGIEVLIVPDDDLTLQALRTELRPETAEIDGILGTAALAPTSLDVDPPDNRLLLRCERTGCISRPALIQDSDRSLVTTCVARAGNLPP